MSKILVVVMLLKTFRSFVYVLVKCIKTFEEQWMNNALEC